MLQNLVLHEKMEKLCQIFKLVQEKDKMVAFFNGDRHNSLKQKYEYNGMEIVSQQHDIDTNVE